MRRRRGGAEGFRWAAEESVGALEPLPTFFGRVIFDRAMVWIAYE